MILCIIVHDVVEILILEMEYLISLHTTACLSVISCSENIGWTYTVCIRTYYINYLGLFIMTCYFESYYSDTKSIHKSRRNAKRNSIFIFIHVTQQQSLKVLFNLYLVPFNLFLFLFFLSALTASQQRSQNIWIELIIMGQVPTLRNCWK